LRIAWREFLEEKRSDRDLTIEDVQISGDLAYVWGGLTPSNTEKEDGEVEEEEGNTVFVLRRESDGTWKIVIEIWNTNDSDDDDGDDE
jgi:ketosteroid isomerase-like protein